MRILMAEDDRSLSRAITAYLTQAGLSVDAVYDGEAALDALTRESYDLIVLDIMMPRLDGLNVLRRLRDLRVTTPVLILSARGEVEDKVEGLENGANDYLSKPFDLRELLARIRVLTRGMESETLITCGNVTLNTETCTLSGPRGNYRLVRREYQLMRFMMENAGNVLSPEMLLDRLWGQDSDAWVNTVWTYVSYLRRKLESIGANISIRTKRNTGYYLEVDK